METPKSMVSDKARKVLIADDEPDILEILKYNLSNEGYDVFTAKDGDEALEKARRIQPDLVILDVMLPEVDGYTICESIRLQNSTVPILFLSAKNTSEDKITGFKRGADDYMTKPFNLEEFLLRVQALVKRGLTKEEKSGVDNIYRFDGYEINFSTYQITGKNSESIALTKKEIMLLRLLIERRNEVVSREQILETVWGYDIYPSTRTVDNFILAFRKYFEPDSKKPKYFFSIRGVGYKFVYDS